MFFCYLVNIILEEYNWQLPTIKFYSATVRQRKLGVDGGDVEDPGGVLPPGGQVDHGDDVEMCGGWEVGILPSSGGNESSGITPHSGEHSETTGNHRGTGSMLTHI